MDICNGNVYGKGNGNGNRGDGGGTRVTEVTRGEGIEGGEEGKKEGGERREKFMRTDGRTKQR